MWQQILVIIAVLGAIIYLILKFFQKPKGGAACDRCAKS
ncbi:MAG: FeoB-associated Cys-rich membrane protein [Bacteroidetes bacterium]|nr:FeoB-associated Cys-rich membrane protein [Bacteroidota bacterium]MDA1269057.1 FeoB-associated Cys-rich membrane protein [Bacteroidota bacterium]